MNEKFLLIPMITQRLGNKLIEISRALIHEPVGEQKHFSFLLRRNKVVSIGWNQKNKTHPLTLKYGHLYKTIHSEVAVIRNFPHRSQHLPDFTLVNIRISREDNVTISRPCVYCRRLIADFGITDVYYTDEKGNFKELF